MSSVLSVKLTENKKQFKIETCLILNSDCLHYSNCLAQTLRPTRYSGLAGQPCCMAGTIDSFSYGRIDFPSYAKHFHCSYHATWLLCKSSVVKKNCGCCCFDDVSFHRFDNQGR